jgi:hypothetical protein
MSTNDRNIFITSHNQMGGVTAHTVNLGPQARQMNSQISDQLKQEIPLTAAVKVVALLGDGEAFGFANQILQWLKSNGYNKAEGVDQAVYSQPVLGQILNKKSGAEFELIIGTRQ